jgi:hypothetical protein
MLEEASAATPFETVQRAAAALGRDRVLGIVLNRVPPHLAYASSGYYGDYGYYHYSTGTPRAEAPPMRSADIGG